MLQETILRLDGIDNLSSPVIICNVDHRFLVAQQLQDINIEKPTILLEPVGRNTAPAIVAGALKIVDKDSILLILSADHIIQNIDNFHQSIKFAIKQAQDDKLVTFGIVPDSANTGYGYIQTGDSINDAFKVAKFIEKPDQKKADEYFKTGIHLWNSGMFMFKARVLLDEVNKHAPEILNWVKKSVDNARQDLDFMRLNDDFFAKSQNISIDYALIEKSNNVVVVPLDANWSDIGSWDALYNISNKDKNGNSIVGDVITIETSNSYINAQHHMVATIGVDNLIIVDTANATLVATKDKAQEVKKIVEKLQLTKRCEQEHHRKVYRPWGWYDSIETGDTFQVKRLHVKPKGKLSLQLHHKRAEHWVIITGEASVTNGDKIFTLKKGQSTYIPIGVKHALANKTNQELEIIEVQSGTYLGEDDIERFEDIYGRV
jgi:mannose-1-phosphate guanylyltransferase/mannose-6-phosphate isomerase